MNKILLKSLSFGLTSGIITTLGFIISFYFATQSKILIIGGIITIAVADSFSDALGMHLSVESENKYSTKEIWITTLITFASKALFTLTFIVPFILFADDTALIVCVLWAFLILILLSYILAKKQNKNPLHIIFEHVLISVFVIFATYFIGMWINRTFI